MFEGGAAWAVKQKSAIGLAYKDYDNDVPTYLKNMLKIKLDCATTDLTRDRYLSIVYLINTIIDYLNRNYAVDSDKKALLSDVLPTDIELSQTHRTIDSYFNQDLVSYWNYYVNHS